MSKGSHNVGWWRARARGAIGGSSTFCRHAHLLAILVRNNTALRSPRVCPQYNAILVNAANNGGTSACSFRQGMSLRCQVCVAAVQAEVEARLGRRGG